MCVQDYEVSIILHHSLFLVDVVKEAGYGRVLKLDSIEKGKKVWIGMDMLIFNTWHWWSRTGNTQPYVDIIPFFIYQTHQSFLNAFF